MENINSGGVGPSGHVHITAQEFAAKYQSKREVSAVDRLLDYFILIGVALPGDRVSGLSPKLRHGHRLAPARPGLWQEEDDQEREGDGHQHTPVRRPGRGEHPAMGSLIPHSLQGAPRREGDQEASQGVHRKRHLYADWGLLQHLGAGADLGQEQEDDRPEGPHDRPGPGDRLDLQAEHGRVR